MLQTNSHEEKFIHGHQAITSRQLTVLSHGSSDHNRNSFAHGVNKTQKSGTSNFNDTLWPGVVQYPGMKQSPQEHAPKLHRDGPIQQAELTGLLPNERKYKHMNEDLFWRGLLESSSSAKRIAIQHHSNYHQRQQ
jgi:hypothetical protein